MAESVRAGNVTNTSYGYRQIRWDVTAMDSDDSGDPVQMGMSTWFSVQFIGTIGSGGSVQMEASNDGGTTWNLIGTAVTASLTAGVIQAYLGCYQLVRPHVTAGDGTTSIKAYCVAKEIPG